MAKEHKSLLESQTSINASLDDFPAQDVSPTIPSPELGGSSQHLQYSTASGGGGGRSAVASEYSEDASSSVSPSIERERRSYSPPAWRKAGAGWFEHQPSLSPTRRTGSPSHQRYGFASRKVSPQMYHSADEEDQDDQQEEEDHGVEGEEESEGEEGYRTATRIPLPASPTKGRSPSHSPEAADYFVAQEGEDADDDGVGREEDQSPEPEGAEPPIEQGNYIRFSSSIAVQQRTDAIEAAIDFIRRAMQHIFKSRLHGLFYLLSALFISWICMQLSQTPLEGPVLDLAKVANLANSFEPVIYYSEAGHVQIGELQDTGVAVWDLSESVRTSNVTSAPIIVDLLEDLSDSLKELSVEMTLFFTGLESDVDIILTTMEWAARELTVLSQTPYSTVSSVWSNAHSLMTKSGLVSADSNLVNALIGPTIQQHTRNTIERTFNEFLNVMEESINNEMQYTLRLFGLFESIDGKFLNLHRTVVREQDNQDRSHSDVLASLWTKVAGFNAARLRKYERNSELLQSVRDRTVRNKHVLVEHNQRLLEMKASLEILRRRLVAPLLRAPNTTNVSIEAQVLGLQETYASLKRVRETQKRKKMELLYASRAQRDQLQFGVGFRGHGGEVEGGGRR